MARIQRLVIPLAKAERRTLEEWAERERLPMATAARRVLLDAAELRGQLDLTQAGELRRQEVKRD